MARRSAKDNDAPAFDLKADRKKRGISQVEAAKILCVTQPTVARWEQSGGMPHVYRVIWNIHWHQEQTSESMRAHIETDVQRVRKSSKEKTSESKDNRDNASASKSAGRDRHDNVVNLYPRKAVERRSSNGNISSGRAGSDSGSFARRKSVNRAVTKDNGLRIIPCAGCGKAYPTECDWCSTSVARPS